MNRKKGGLIYGVIIGVMLSAYSMSVEALETKEVIVTIEKEATKEQIEVIEEKHHSVIESSEDEERMVMNLTEKQIVELEKNSTVKAIEENQIVTADAQEIGYGFKNVRGMESRENAITGLGIKIAVIDSGVAEHSDLKIKGGKSFVEYTDSYNDDNGHGTHVTGIINAQDNGFGVLGLAPDAEIYALKVLNKDGVGDLYSIIRAVEWAIENQMDVINMSIGMDGHSQELESVLSRAYANGILIVGSAGNDYGKEVRYPAKYETVIAVSAVDANNRLTDFTNKGQEIEISAPGLGVKSTFMNNGYMGYNGTSMAAPFVTAQLALLKEMYPTLTSPQIRDKMRKTVIDLGIPGKDSEFGYGLVQSGVPINEIIITKKTGLYDSVGSMNPLGFLERQTLPISEKGPEGWVKVDVNGELRWIKNDYRYTRVYVNQTSGLYNTESGDGKIVNITPQFVKARDVLSNGWMLIESYKGLKWLKDGYTAEKIYFDKTSGLYEKPDGKTKVGLVGPQTIQVLDKTSDGWYLIDSYKGRVWIKNGMNVQRVWIAKTSGLYDTATDSEKVGSFAPQFVNAIQVKSDGWILMQSYLGQKWTKVGVNTIHVNLTQNSGIYKTVGAQKVGSLSPQRIKALEYKGNGWYKINSYKGVVYLKNGYNLSK